MHTANLQEEKRQEEKIESPVPDNREPHPHHIPRGKVAFGALVLLAVVAAAWLGGYLPHRNQEAAAAAAATDEKNAIPVVTTAVVRSAPADIDLLLPGSISSVSEASIFARAAGYVSKRYADIGDHVKAGQLLAEIVAPDLDQQVAQARAQVAQAEQQLGQARAALIQAEAQRDLARATLVRYEGLIKTGAVAQQDYETQVSNAKTADALVVSQQANIVANQDNVNQAQANLDRVIALQEFKNVRAPFDGVVTARNVDVGYLISAAGGGLGATPATQPGASQNNANGNEMFRVAQVSKLRIFVSVPQSSAASIRVGMPATILIAEMPGTEFPAKVTRTSNVLDPNTRTLLTEVEMSSQGGKLLSGMYATVRFRSHRDKPPLLVRGDALLANAAGASAAVLEDAGRGNGLKKVHLQRVQVGRDYGAEAEIESGLKSGDIVVVNPGDEIREGALVTPAKGGAAGPSGAAR
jgi:multidrug efflux pump subunit AcrA (membrane-fusion protein)